MEWMTPKDPVTRLLSPGPEGEWQVLGAGFITLDLVHESNSKREPRTDRVAYLGGGTVSNVLCHLSRFGWNTKLIGTVGDDETSRRLRHDLELFGVDLKWVVSRPRTRTTRVVHCIQLTGPKLGQHCFSSECLCCGQHLDSNAGSFTTTELDSLIADLPRQTILIVDRANSVTNLLACEVRRRDGLVVFEPGHVAVANDFFRSLVAQSHVLKFSEKLTVGEAPFGQSDLRVLDGPEIVIETRGTGGVRIVLPQRRKEVRMCVPARMRQIDSAGAGDAFTASFIAALGPERLRAIATLDIQQLESAIVIGQIVGGLATLFLGAKGIAYQRSVEQLVEAIRMVLSTGQPPPAFPSTPLEITHFFSPIIQRTDFACPVCGSQPSVEVNHA